MRVVPSQQNILCFGCFCPCFSSPCKPGECTILAREKEHNVHVDGSVAWVDGVLWGSFLACGGHSYPSLTVFLTSPLRWPSWWELMLPRVMDTDVLLAPRHLAGGCGLCLCTFGADCLQKLVPVRTGLPHRLAHPLSPFSWQKHGIPVPVTPQTPWSMDENLMHIR